ncbi:DUF4232 domain-containing protein [Streptomyces sp. XY006]|uniref:DUF4232 domain-containing protein n=1 Tax=Streptomyces sp. XY006 TaxID=2021410 RepID=UPI000B8BDACA|nr:DUF4232 domain-containing protein [Streptomyces sp. XY006]OXS31628.1 hypothetical protein CHR28_29880 [Streptomyces sp. XY006]
MRKYHALPVALLAALALTACEDGTGTQNEGAAASASVTPGASGTGDRPAAEPTKNTGNAQDPQQASKGTTNTNGTTGTTNSTTGDTTGTTGKGSGKAGKPAERTRVSCNGSNTTVTARPVPRPLNHMLITVRNTGSATCDLTYYPVLRFDEMQWAPQAIEDSKPQAVTTLAPGESGYAGVALSAADGSGEAGTTGRKLAVGFQGRTPNSSGGPSALPALPAKGVYYDSTLRVTYWLHDMDQALSY